MTKILIDRATAEQTLEALDSENPDIQLKAALALRTVLEQQQAKPVQEPTPWRDMVVVSLVREGVNKHKARELADHFATQPLPVQEPAAMRMPKVGDKVICLEDESLGEVVSLTAGGSPDIKFADGSHGTYLLREFAELFGYAEQRQPLTKDEALTLEALKYAASKGDGRIVREMKIAPFVIKDETPEPPQYSFKAHWTDDKRIGVVACVTRPDGGVHLMQTIIDLPPAQPEQEPVAWMSSDRAWMWSDYSKAIAAVANIPTLTLIPLYVAPPMPVQEDAFEGWVKIDEVRKHFDSVGCGTIYKTAGEDRVPLYTAPPQRQWVGLTPEEVQFYALKHRQLVNAHYDAASDTNIIAAAFEATVFYETVEQALKDKNHG